MAVGATGKFPNTAAEMDTLLGFEGERKPDGIIIPTPGRNKVEWKPAANVKIVYEEHPYDVTAPAYHQGQHWHLTTPAGDMFAIFPVIRSRIGSSRSYGEMDYWIRSAS